MASIPGGDLWLLKNDRSITKRRLWGMRIALAVLFVSGLTQNYGGAGPGIVYQPFRFTGFVLGTALLYWLLLRGLSTSEPQQATAERATATKS